MASDGVIPVGVTRSDAPMLWHALEYTYNSIDFTIGFMMDPIVYYCAAMLLPVMGL